ncbi:MAG: hypothetical protein K2W95_30395 [Candidatus Obscuribacterales bacterium]|nr:hypothetical protein [Candidatus Obscuribacterales bacterium]
MSDTRVDFAPAVCSFESSSISAACWTPSSCENVVMSASTTPVMASVEAPAVTAAAPALELNTAKLYAGDSNTVKAATTLDASKSISQMVQDGTMVKSDKPQIPEQRPCGDKETPKITVTKDASQPADFIVRKDGKVEVVGDPEAGSGPHKDYKIRVEEGADQKVTDELVNYLANKCLQGEKKPTLQADEGLVSDAVKQQFAPPQEEKLPEEKELPDELDPDKSGPSPNCGPDGGPGPTPDTNPDDQLEPDKGGDKIEPEKDARPTKAPIEVLRDSIRSSAYDNVQANSLGAYNCNYIGWFGSFLTEEMLEELGNPPDMKKLGKVLAKYKNDPKFKAKMDQHVQNLKDQGDTESAGKIEGMFNKLATDDKFADEMGTFLNGQLKGDNATKEDLAKFFDPKMQDAVANSQMADAAKEMGVKIKDMNEKQAGELALTMLLGHKATEAEKQSYANYVSTISDNFKRLKRA